VRVLLIGILLTSSCANAVHAEKNPPTDWSIKAGAERNLLWSATVGRESYGAPVVSDGFVWIGTNNATPRDPAVMGDASVLMCFRAENGEFLWQHVSPRNPEHDRHGDWGSVPLRSIPLVQGDRLWFMNNRWEVICLDIAPLKEGKGVPGELWRTDLIAHADIWPMVLGMGWGNALSILPFQGRIYLSTSNGVNFRTRKPERPNAPALVCLDMKTGQIVGRERSGISARTIESTWSSPALASHDGRTMLLFGGGDGFLYAFDPVPTKDGTLRELWRADCRRTTEPLELAGISATPVVHGGRVYIALGQEAHSSGPGQLSCLDLASGRRLWSVSEFELTSSTFAVQDGLLVAPAGLGIIYGFDPTTGRKLWEYDCLSMIRTSPILVDGRVYLTNGDDEVVILDVRDPGRKPRAIRREMAGCGSMSPVISNGTLYVAGGRQLWAIRQKNAGPSVPSLPAEKRGRAPDARYLPTPEDIVWKMVELAYLTENSVLYDLGSGDGRIVIAAVNHANCRAIGVELDPSLVEESRKRIKEANFEARAKIVHEDLLNVDFSDATVVTLYVGDRLNRLLSPKLQALKPGSRIVSHRFPVPGLKLDRSVKVTSREDGQEHEVFVYDIPHNK
jgi:outer membrane protein assembly factor BamB